MAESQHLVEKHARLDGLGEVTVSYLPIGSPAAMTDAVLSGSADLAATGVPPFILLWSKTHDKLAVKTLTALNSQPAFLNTNKASIKTLRDFGPAIHDTLLEAWRRHLVLILRDQTLRPDRMLQIARSFGEVDLAPPFDNEKSKLDGYPEIAVVSNLRKDGVALGGLGAGELSWHSDMTYRAKPPVGCILTAVEVPPSGGDTHFLILVAALKAVSPTTRAKLAGLRLVHDAQYTSAGTARREGSSFARIDHPLVALDPLSEREILFLGRRRQSVVIGAADEQESLDLLDELWAPLDQGRFSIGRQWRPADVVFWANMAVMRQRDAFDAEARRLLLRAQLATINPLDRRQLNPSPIS